MTRSRKKWETSREDVIILTETHLSKDKDIITKMEKYLQEYNVFHTHDRDNASERKGVSIELKKNIIDIDKVEIRIDEGTNDEGRWIRINLHSILDKPLHIWGIYAPTLAKERKQWMKEIREEISKKMAIES